MNQGSASTLQQLAEARQANVVIIDDDSALVRALRFDLEIEGFFVDTHLSPATLRTEDLPTADACLVIDFRLPGMTGLELLGRLRKNGVRLPAIIITTAPSAALGDKAAALGAVVVEKPLLGDRLIRSIRSALRTPT